MIPAIEPSVDSLCARLEQQFGELTGICEICNDQIIMEVPVESLIEITTALRDEEQFAFDQLMDLCGVDFSAYGQVDWLTQEASSSGFSRGVSAERKQQPDSEKRFAVVYQLLSLTHNQRLRLRVFSHGEPPIIPSVTTIWNSADWY